MAPFTFILSLSKVMKRTRDIDSSEESSISSSPSISEENSHDRAFIASDNSIDLSCKEDPLDLMDANIGRHYDTLKAAAKNKFKFVGPSISIPSDVPPWHVLTQPPMLGDTPTPSAPPKKRKAKMTRMDAVLTESLIEDVAEVLVNQERGNNWWNPIVLA